MIQKIWFNRQFSGFALNYDSFMSYSALKSLKQEFCKNIITDLGCGFVVISKFFTQNYTLNPEFQPLTCFSESVIWRIQIFWSFTQEIGKLKNTKS